MLNAANLKQILFSLGFKATGDMLEKTYSDVDAYISIDFKKEEISYPKDLRVSSSTTCNFSQNENFVVLECVDRLLTKGYRPEHLELERTWKLGHDEKGGRADITVSAENGSTLAIIECKTAGVEYEKEKKNLLTDGGQLFSYWQQERGCEWLILYASDFNGEKVTYTTESVCCTDDENVVRAAKHNPTVRTYAKATTVTELYQAWHDTYRCALSGDVIFRDDSTAYHPETKPLRKRDLIDFKGDNTVISDFLEILRHNNVSDKENAFNRLIALFICKLADEFEKGPDDVVEFQYRAGTDTYESLQDRLQRLYRDGMRLFMGEDIFYLPDTYADDLVQQYHGRRREKMVGDLKDKIRRLKFYTNNDFAFKDVHNEELFLQNGIVLTEMVGLFQKYRIIESGDLQTLGDLFEQLLNQGFKQDEGQFFTPVPVCRFMLDSLPLEQMVREQGGLRVIDYACGAGHFLTEAAAAISDASARAGIPTTSEEVASGLYGIEKDYRLSRVSKVELFMHGVGGGTIVFGDGLDNHAARGIEPASFDALVANPPYSVKAFKPYLDLRENSLDVLECVSDEGNQIQTAFVERIPQLLRPRGVAAVVLPSSILTDGAAPSIFARTRLIETCEIVAVASMGSKTFGETGTTTAVLFLRRFDEPPKKSELVLDSVEASFASERVDEWEAWEDSGTLAGYLAKTGVSEDEWRDFTRRARHWQEWSDAPHFKRYASRFPEEGAYRNKVKLKSFSRAGDEERQAELDRVFYDWTHGIEREKLRIFALVRGQQTLVLTAPTSTKEQEAFLGYKWETRNKGRGIKKLKDGGLLYDPDDRCAQDTAAGGIRAMFEDGDVDAPSLEPYTRVRRLADMIDFEPVAFNKELKLAGVALGGPFLHLKTFPVKRLGDIIRFQTEKADIAQKDYGDYISTTNILANADGVEPYTGDFSQLKDGTIYETGDILMANIRPYLKKIWLAEHDGLCSTDVLVLHPSMTEHVLTEYLYTVLIDDLFVDYVMEGARGLKMPRGDKEAIKDFLVPMPPLDIQRRIVSEAADLDARIAVAQAVADACLDENERAFNEMFGDRSSGFKYPTAALAEICQAGNGKTPSKDVDAYWADNTGMPFLSSVPLGAPYVNLSIVENFTSAEAVADSKTKKAPAGSICVGVRVGVGKVSVAPTDCCVSQDIAVVEPLNDGAYDPMFLRFAIASDASRLESLQRGSIIQGITLSDLLATEVPLPPLELQREFSVIVRENEKRRSHVLETKAALETKRSELLERYFG